MKGCEPIMAGRRERCFVPAAFVMLAFVESVLIDAEMVASIVEEQATELLMNPDVKRMGYDYGLMVHALRDGELRDRMMRILLDVRDESGVWGEYYVEQKPNGTLYRPWESGLNLAGMLEEWK